MAQKPTKERIVDAAILLFNRSGVGAVTTNHIAAHLGISPGNLYYHFENKEEIIRSAWDRLNREADDIWRLEPAPDPLALHRILTGNIALCAKYLFLMRELYGLVRSDPELRESYRLVKERRIRQLEQNLTPLMELGLLKNLEGDDLRCLTENAWLLGFFGIPSAELVTHDANPERDIAYAARHVLFLFKPYMSRAAYELLTTAVTAGIELATADMKKVQSGE